MRFGRENGATPRRRRGVAGIVVVAASIMAFGATQALGTVIWSFHYANEPYTFAYDDCGFDVVVEGLSSGHLRLRDGKGKTETAFPVSDNYSYSETHTNPATGAYVTITGNGVFNEIKATHVEGTIFLFEAVDAGQPFRLYDSDGNLVARDRGSIRHRFLFDTEGDDVPGGIYLDAFPSEPHGPHPGFENFCGLITPLIGS